MINTNMEAFREGFCDDKVVANQKPKGFF